MIKTEICKEIVQRINTTTQLCISSNPKEKVFPKCCPLNYSYDKIGRSCIYNQKNRFNNHNFFKIGLRNCVNKIVTDYYDVDVKFLQEKFGNDNDYCMDEVYGTKEIVFRKCERNYCGINGVKCLRKCCPDQEIYVQATCSGMLNITFNYTNWTDKLAVIKGILVILFNFLTI